MLGTQKRPRCVGGAKKTLPIDFDVNAGAPFSPNLHLWFPDTPSFLDGYVRFTDGLADSHIRRPGAVFAAKRTDTVSITYFCGARGQRKKGRTCQRSRDSQSTSCSHSEISLNFSTYVNAPVGMADAARKPAINMTKVTAHQRTSLGMAEIIAYTHRRLRGTRYPFSVAGAGCGSFG
jgi:hypothetical protein